MRGFKLSMRSCSFFQAYPLSLLSCTLGYHLDLPFVSLPYKYYYTLNLVHIQFAICTKFSDYLCWNCTLDFVHVLQYNGDSGKGGFYKMPIVYENCSPFWKRRVIRHTESARRNSSDRELWPQLRTEPAVLMQRLLPDFAKFLIANLAIWWNM